MKDEPKPSFNQVPLFVSHTLTSDNSLLIALTIGTIPLTLLLSTVVEQALWGSICFSIILVDLITSKKPNYVRLISIVSIATLFRQPSFIGILPVILNYFWLERKNIKHTSFYGNLLLVISPVLIFLPFLISSLIFGTPSTSSVDAINLISMLSRPYEALKSDRILISILNSVSVFWIIFIPFAFFPLSRFQLKNNILFFIFFTALIFVFYSIEPTSWGEAKYQAEYAVPFAVAGFIMLFINFRNLILSKLTLYIILIIIIVFNVIEFYDFPNHNKPVDQLIDTIAEDKQQYNVGFRMMVTLPYSYENAYQAVKEAELASNSYSLGVTYGVLPEILNGYTVKEVLEVAKISSDQMAMMKELGVTWTSASVDLIDSDSRIKAVIIGFVFPGKTELVVELKRRGWMTLGEFHDSKFGSTVFVLRRH